MFIIFIFTTCKKNIYTDTISEELPLWTVNSELSSINIVLDVIQIVITRKHHKIDIEYLN